MARFPNLPGSGSTKTSDYSLNYNCFAFALGETNRWLQPLSSPGFKTFWPPGVARQETLGAYKLVFALRGYAANKDSALEEGYEKVALYLDARGHPKHAALQMPDGRWMSKLGYDVDIEHPELSAVECATYGKATVFLRRKRPAPPAAETGTASTAATSG